MLENLRASLYNPVILCIFHKVTHKSQDVGPMYLFLKKKYEIRNKLHDIYKSMFSFHNKTIDLI